MCDHVCCVYCKPGGCTCATYEQFFFGAYSPAMCFLYEGRTRAIREFGAEKNKLSRL